MMKMRLTGSHCGRLGFALLLSLGLASIVACGPSGPSEIPVKGKVTFGGGAWPKPPTLDFAAVKPAAGMPNKPATAVADLEGNYSVKLVPGEYVVNITCWEVEPAPDDPTKQKSYVPKRFNEAERQKIEVPLEGKKTIEVNWDVPKQ